MREVDVSSLLIEVEKGEILKKLSLELYYTNSGQKVIYSGVNSVVIKVVGNGKLYGLKCYTTTQKSLINRLFEIESYFNSFPNEIISIQKLLPVRLSVTSLRGSLHNVTMALYPFVEGCSLEELIVNSMQEYNLSKITTALNQFLSLSLSLLRAPFTHGDVKCANVIIAKERAMFIDSDSINFERCGKSADVDNYPILTIILLLLGLENDFIFISSLNGVDLLEMGTTRELQDIFLQLFKGDLIESKMAEMLCNIDTYRLKFYIEKLIEKRESVQTNGCALILAQSSTSGLWGILSSNAEVVYPYVFEDTTPITDGVFGVKVDGCWAFMSSDLKLLTTFDFEEITHFYQNRAAIKKGGKWGFVDTHLNAITPIKYQGVNYFREGSCVVIYNNQYGYINLQGQEIVEPQYKFAYNSRDGVLRVVDSSGDEMDIVLDLCNDVELYGL